MLSDAKFWYLYFPKTSHIIGLYQAMSHGKEKKLCHNWSSPGGQVQIPNVSETMPKLQPKYLM